MGNVAMPLTTEKAQNFGSDAHTITTLEIAEMMNMEHSKLLRKLEGDETHKGIIPILGEAQLGSTDYFIKSTYLTSQNKEMPCYKVTKMGCDFLANKFTGEKGIIFTARYVKRFHEMEQELKPKIPKSYKEALLETVRLLEENERLETENFRMKPKEEFFDAVAGSKDAIEIGKVAKILDYPGIGRNKLFDILREKKILMKDNTPYQKYIDCGYFRTIEQKYNMPDGEVRINIKTLVYQKGIDYIRKVLEAA